MCFLEWNFEWIDNRNKMQQILGHNPEKWIIFVLKTIPQLLKIKKVFLKQITEHWNIQNFFCNTHKWNVQVSKNFSEFFLTLSFYIKSILIWKPQKLSFWQLGIDCDFLFWWKYALHKCIYSHPMKQLNNRVFLNKHDLI